MPLTDGSIPACTGKPSTASPMLCPQQVYPRMYGETVDTAAGPCLVQGLSPHVRGNPQRKSHPTEAERSIPACTGKPTER